jgi:hypothetical protein
MLLGAAIAAARVLEPTNWISPKLMIEWIGVIWKEFYNCYAFIANGCSGLWSVLPLSDTQSISTMFHWTSSILLVVCAKVIPYHPNCFFMWLMAFLRFCNMKFNEEL